MAQPLDQEQRAKVRFFLGYPNLETRYTINSCIPLVNYTALALEENMRSILDVPSLMIITNIINQIECLRNNINSARSRLKAVKLHGAVDLNNREIDQLWVEDYRLCEQLSELLAIPIYRHPAINNSSNTIRVIGD